QHALFGNHEEADGGEPLLARRAELLVGVDAGLDLAHAREVVVRVAARVRVGRAGLFGGPVDRRVVTALSSARGERDGQQGGEAEGSLAHESLPCKKNRPTK